VPLWKWTYNNPQHSSRYYCTYYFGKWNTCLKGSLPPFPLPHQTTSAYPYHQRQILDFNGRVIANPTHIDMVQWTSTMTTHVAMVLAHEKTQSYTDWTLSNDFIAYAIETYGCLHSHFYSFSITYMCTDHYCMPLMVLFNPLDACFLLSTMHVHNSIACANHNNFLASCYIWLWFFISSAHHS
jgi:hypothetical protein